jgi:pimeloyl-ACP methyl ester carboxylesterase
MIQDNSPVNIESLQIEVNGWRAHYLKAGNGAPVVLVHGGASDSRDWRPIMAQYSDRFSFYAPDLPGFGESDRDPKGYYLGDYTDFLLGFIDLLKLEKPALVGHSFGGRVSLDVALQTPDNIGKIILIDTSGLGQMSPFGTVLFYFFKWMRDILRRPQPFPRFLTREGDNWNEIRSEALKKIKVPTLLIWKRTDPYLSVKQAQRAQQLIAGAKLEIIGGYGHAPHQQKDKSAFYRLMLEFLTQSS